MVSVRKKASTLKKRASALKRSVCKSKRKSQCDKSSVCRWSSRKNAKSSCGRKSAKRSVKRSVKRSARKSARKPYVNKNPNMCTPLTRDACNLDQSCRWSRRKPLSSSSCGLEPRIGHRQQKPSNKCTQLRKKDCNDDDDCSWWRRTRPSYSSCGLNPRRKPNPPVLPFFDEEKQLGPPPLYGQVIPPNPLNGFTVPPVIDDDLMSNIFNPDGHRHTVLDDINKNTNTDKWW
jgi:hypothetical protein